MKNLLFVFAVSVLLFACSTTKIGVKENWIDERDILALIAQPSDVLEWTKKVGRPVLVEMNKDTVIYYYNYRPTLYAVSQNDTMSFIFSSGSSIEKKPKDEQALEIWGSRYDFMQIKFIENAVKEITVVGGADKKRFLLDMNGAWVAEPGSGFKADVSEEFFVNEEMLELYKSAGNTVHFIPEPVATVSEPVPPAEVAPVAEHQAVQPTEAAQHFIIPELEEKPQEPAATPHPSSHLPPPQNPPAPHAPAEGQHQ